MPALSTRIISFVLRKTGLFRKMFAGGPGMAVFIAKAAATPSAPSAKLQQSHAISHTSFDGCTVWEFAPKTKAPTATVLYWHGGGYVYPAADAHWAFMAHMAETHGWRIVAPLYPLAPAHDVAGTTGFALSFYKDFLAKQAGAPFLMAGDSAGAGLTAATVIAARDAGLALPAKLILICPWLNADPSHPDQPEIEKRDAILTIAGIRDAGQMYAGAAGAADPRVSPIHADWSGLPPILSFGGGSDILVVDARALKAKLPSVDYQEMDGMIHDWPIFTFPESRQAQARMAAFAAA